MSDTEGDVPESPALVGHGGLHLTPKEESALKAAFRCLKSVPEVRNHPYRI